MELLAPDLQDVVDLVKYNVSVELVLVGQLGAYLQVLLAHVEKLHHAPAAEEQLGGLLLLVVQLAEGVSASDVEVVHPVFAVELVLHGPLLMQRDVLEVDAGVQRVGFVHDLDLLDGLTPLQVLVGVGYYALLRGLGVR